VIVGAKVSRPTGDRDGEVVLGKGLGAKVGEVVLGNGLGTKVGSLSAAQMPGLGSSRSVC
jgi:hypothetical protein